MKKILILLLISTQAYPVTFGKYRSSPDGVASQKFVTEGKAVRFEKTSNYFDLTQKDYSVGVFKLNEPSPEFTRLMEKVEEFSKKFSTVDEFLKTKDSSFNELAGDSGHDVVILVNDFRVKPDSKYYKELDAIFKKMRKLDWKHTDGYRVTEDLKELSQLESGKVIKTVPYARDMYCRKLRPPTICTFHGGGEIYVK